MLILGNHDARNGYMAVYSAKLKGLQEVQGKSHLPDL